MTFVNTYGTSGIEKGLLVKKTLGNYYEEYTHDRYGRLVKKVRNAYTKQNFETEYACNSKNQLEGVTYPGGLTVSYSYDDKGFPTSARSNGLVLDSLVSYDGLVATHLLPYGMTYKKTLASNLTLQNLNICKGDQNLFDMDFNYDPQSGNLLSRTGMLPEKETFEYDALDRLVSVNTGNTPSLNISYANNGNIMSKTDVGNYTYSSVKPHAVMKIDNANAYQYTSDLTTEYNDMGRIKLISQRQTYPISMKFTYGADGSLWNLDYTPSMRSTDIGGHRAWSRYYDDNYEYLYSAAYRRDFYYLTDQVMAVRDYDKDFKFYVVAKDNLGSIVGIYNANGDKVFSASYDAWGKQTVSDTKDDMHLMLHGYCGHTMLSEFDLIDMKGRLYDPVVGRFLSPDNYVQLPGNSQNYNRYSYCLNNPLKYTDPSGEFFIFTAITDFVGNVFKHGLNFRHYNWKKTINAWNIDRGMFKGNLLQVLNKWTYGMGNSVIGNLAGNALNIFGKVDRVTYLDGMAALSGVTGGNSAFTVGFYSFGPTNYTADWRDNLFVHEYGHYIQSQRLGSNYFPVVAEPSFFSALATSKWLGMEHKERWFEVEASELGAKHFDKKYGKGVKGYKSGNANFFNVEQFWGKSDESYVNPRLGHIYQDKKFRHSGYKFVFWDFFSSIF